MAKKILSTVMAAVTTLTLSVNALADGTEEENLFVPSYGLFQQYTEALLM